jgi:hypothetical protein
VEVSLTSEYNSHNTHQMNQLEMIRLLLTLDCVKEAFKTGALVV